VNATVVSRVRTVTELMYVKHYTWIGFVNYSLPIITDTLRIAVVWPAKIEFETEFKSNYLQQTWIEIDRNLITTLVNITIYIH